MTLCVSSQSEKTSERGWIGKIKVNSPELINKMRTSVVFERPWDFFTSIILLRTFWAAAGQLEILTTQVKNSFGKHWQLLTEMDLCIEQHILKHKTFFMF